MPSGGYQSGNKNQADFSQAAISKAVLAETLQKPYVLYPGAVGLLGVAGAALLGPSMLFVLPAAAGMAVSLGAWSIDYFLRRDKHAGAYLRQLHRNMSDRRAQALTNLRLELKKGGSQEGLSQLTRLEEKYRAFEELLASKLDPNELTYARYLGMAEQVFLACLDNLQRIVSAIGSVRAIDAAYLADRIGELAAHREPSASQQQELKALRSRMELRQEQLAKIDQWLAQNERAMTSMDETMAAVAQMVTVQGHATTDMETAMKELQALARRASDYSMKRD